MREKKCLLLSVDFLGAKLFSVPLQLGGKICFISKNLRPVSIVLCQMHMEEGQVIGEIADTALLEAV